MQKTWAALGILLVLVGTPARSENTFLIGIGLRSCAYWLSTPSTLNEGSGWLWGFWTGLNYATSSHMVGQSTDAEGIRGAVRKICENAPETNLADAAAMAYAAFRKDGK